MSVAGAILAGGTSSRMGQAKALIPWRGRTLIQEVADLLLQVVPELVVVTSQPEVLPPLEAATVDDVFPGRGPLGGLHAALSHTRARWLLLVGCDQPFLEPGLLSMILARAEATSAGAVVPALSDGRVEPLCAAYSRRILPVLERWLERGGSPRPVHFYDEIEVSYLPPGDWDRFGPADRLFLNINTPGDLERARAMLGEDDREPPS